MTTEYGPPVSLPRRIWRGFWLILVIAILVVHVIGAWVFSTRLIEDAFQVTESEPARNVEVVSLEGGTIALQALDENPDLGRNQVMGFAHDGGYLRLGEVVEAAGDSTEAGLRVVRGYEVVTGAAPSVGALGDIDPFAFPDEPADSGLDIEVVEYEGPLGTYEAWLLEGTRSEWVIHVHGKGASPSEALRLMAGLEDQGYHQLAITYRNDPGQPADPSGYYQYGREEWTDLAAAAEYARQQGATALILAGYSTGGAIVLSYMYKGAPDVEALVLDAPNLDMSATVDHNAAQEELPFGLPIPPTMTAMAKVAASMRASINWNSLDYLERLGQLTTPMLIFHGDDDDWVPVETSRAAADSRPRFVTLVEVDDTGHVQAWNADPMAYEDRVVDFIAASLG